MGLYALLYDNNLTTPVFEAHLQGRVSGFLINWELHGGVRSIEMEWIGNPIEAYAFFQKYDGYRVVVCDHFCDRPVADGFITGIAITPFGARIIANGFWFRHYDQLYNFDVTAQDSEQGSLSYTSDSGDETFTDDSQDFQDWDTAAPGNAAYEIVVTNDDESTTWGFLGDVVSATEVYVYTDYGLTSNGWNGDDPSGKTPSSYSIQLCYDYKTTTDIIKDALSTETPAMHTSTTDIDETSTIIGFWEPPIEEGGMYPGEIIEKLASLSDSSNIQWNYWALSSGFAGTTPQKPVAYFKAQVDDGSFDWQVYKWMIARGEDTFEKNSQELRNDVRVIYRDMSDDDAIAITSAATDSVSQDRYWTREVILSGGDSTPALAGQYGDLYLNKYKGSLLSKPLTLTAPYILDNAGSQWPLWTPIKLCRSYFRMVDLFPAVETFSKSWDRSRAGQAVAMQYISATNQLRVHLDVEDNSIDALLARMTAFR